MATTTSQWNDGQVHRVFVWQHEEPEKVALARKVISQVRAESWRRKSAVVWESYQEVPKGFRLEWKTPSTRATAHRWFWGCLVSEARGSVHGALGGSLGGWSQWGTGASHIHQSRLGPRGHDLTMSI